MKDLAQKKANASLLIFSFDGIHTTGIANIAKSKAEEYKFKWVLQTKIPDPAILYALLRNNAASPCLVYLYDEGGKLFREFGSVENGERLRNLQQFITALDIPSINLFYDGDVANPEFCRQLVKINGINSVIAKLPDTQNQLVLKICFLTGY